MRATLSLNTHVAKMQYQVLSKVASPWSSTQTSPMKAEITIDQDQEVPQNDIVLALEESHIEVPIPYEDPNLSYSDTSLGGEAISSPSKGVLTNPRRQQYIKGQG